jgi:hypothetical protein
MEYPAEPRLQSSAHSQLLAPPLGRKAYDDRFSKGSSEESFTTSTRTTLRVPPRSPQSATTSDLTSTPSQASLTSSTSDQEIYTDGPQEILSRTPTRPVIATGDLRRDIELMKEEANRHSLDDPAREDHLLSTLGPPLPVNPRDTVFSVISGYGHHRTHSDGVSPIVPPLPPRPWVNPETSEAVSVLPPQNGTIATTVSQVAADQVEPVDLVPYRQSYASDYSESSDFVEDPVRDSDIDDDRSHIRESTVSSEYIFQPPAPIIDADDIAAIARQPSPGRVEHGIPLQSRESCSFQRRCRRPIRCDADVFYRCGTQCKKRTRMMIRNMARRYLVERYDVVEPHHFISSFFLLYPQRPFL